MKFKKSLWAAVMLIAVCFTFYPQTSEETASNAAQTEVSSFENNSNYFNQPASENGGQTPSALRSQPGGIWLFLRMIFVLLIVLVLIYGVLWFIKNKTNVANVYIGEF